VGAGFDLDEIGERFDALYTELTGLQRELIAARRGSLDGDRERELADQAAAFLAAFEVAKRSLLVGGPTPREVEAAALRARLFEASPDPHLVLAVLGALNRAYAYPLLVELVHRSNSDDTLVETFGDRSLGAVLAAPKGMGASTARALAAHLGLDPRLAMAELDQGELDRLCDGLRDAAHELPADVTPWRARAPKPAADGTGAGAVVLQAWIDAIGPPRETAREQAVRAAEREGWPTDAVPVAERLLAFTLDHLAPGLVPDWDRIAAIEDLDARLAAMRAERSTAWHAESDDVRVLAIAVFDPLIEAIRSARKARRLVDGPEEAWGSAKPVALARTVGRRCGTVLSFCDPDSVAPLLEDLP
jgi:hypothetical protein